ncbi:MAG: Re/Si-specific NAD(P)(+) transhydrogenase subunit alpha [Bacteroidota bacterium]
MKLGILRETSDDRRVAMLPDSILASKKVFDVEYLVERGAGQESFISDEAYQQIDAQITDRENIFADADIILSIADPQIEELKRMSGGQVLLSVFQPMTNKHYVNELRKQHITAFSLDIIPRITRAQSMDVLSSQATAAGYKAVLEAAVRLPEFFPMLMTAAGTIKPAKVLVLGAGVAGLQAVATARRLGAVVRVFDVRSAVKEEVESLGAVFIEVEGAKDDADAGGYAVEQSDDFKQRQMALIQDYVAKSNVVIATAQIPGKKSPLLIKKHTLGLMKPGSVVVDLAASSGGNCELTENNKVLNHQGVTIIGKSDFPSTIPVSSSLMFGKNVVNFLKLLMDKNNQLQLNFDDEIIRETCVTHQGKLVSERIKNIYSNH